MTIIETVDRESNALFREFDLTEAFLKHIESFFTLPTSLQALQAQLAEYSKSRSSEQLLAIREELQKNCPEGVYGEVNAAGYITLSQTPREQPIDIVVKNVLVARLQPGRAKDHPYVQIYANQINFFHPEAELQLLTNKTDYCHLELRAKASTAIQYPDIPSGHIKVDITQGPPNPSLFQSSHLAIIQNEFSSFPGNEKIPPYVGEPQPATLNCEGLYKLTGQLAEVRIRLPGDSTSQFTTVIIKDNSVAEITRSSRGGAVSSLIEASEDVDHHIQDNHAVLFTLTDKELMLHANGVIRRFPLKINPIEWTKIIKQVAFDLFPIPKDDDTEKLLPKSDDNF